MEVSKDKGSCPGSPHTRGFGICRYGVPPQGKPPNGDCQQEEALRVQIGYICIYIYVSKGVT